MNECPIQKIAEPSGKRYDAHAQSKTQREQIKKRIDIRCPSYSSILKQVKQQVTRKEQADDGPEN
jgi:hypothetical protein